jgi:hypothetical protein
LAEIIGFEWTGMTDPIANWSLRFQSVSERYCVQVAELGKVSPEYLKDFGEICKIAII